MSEIVSDIRDSFRVALDSTGSEEQARDYVLASMDRSLFDPGKEPRIIGKTTIRVYWAGLPYSMRLDLSGRLSTEALPKLAPTRERAVGFTLHIARPLGGSWGVPWVVAIDRDGEMIVSGDRAREALLQVQRARQGQFVKGPFGDSEVKEILQVQGGE
jgi:hypothetical protein